MNRINFSLYWESNEDAKLPGDRKQFGRLAIQTNFEGWLKSVHAQSKSINWISKIMFSSLSKLCVTYYPFFTWHVFLWVIWLPQLEVCWIFMESNLINKIWLGPLRSRGLAFYLVQYKYALLAQTFTQNFHLWELDKPNKDWMKAYHIDRPRMLPMYSKFANACLFVSQNKIEKEVFPENIWD